MKTRRRFGQHFLQAAWVSKVVDIVNPTKDDTILEIGPGPGALTRAMAPKAGRIIGVEIDRDLAAELSEGAPPHVRIVAANSLDVDLDALLADCPGPVRVVGNLPYNVSSPILFRLLAHHGAGLRFSDATLMVQAEVADRLASPAGGSEYGVLAIQAGLHADITRRLTLPPGAFRPAPKVTSAVVTLRFRAPSAEVDDPALFERIVRGIFTQRRKTLLNALRPVTGLETPAIRALLEAIGIDPNRRPQTLSVEEAARLARAVGSSR